MVGVLLAAGADPNALGKAGIPPLHVDGMCGFAVANEEREFIEADLNEQGEGGWTPLHSAAVEGHERVVEKLLEAGADPNLHGRLGWTALHVAAEYDHERVLKTSCFSTLIQIRETSTGGPR